MMMNDMLKKYNSSSLKDTSKDNEEYMTNSEKIKVINFDNLSKKGYSKMLRLKGQSFPFKTNDALYLDVENNKFIFIDICSHFIFFKIPTNYTIQYFLYL